MEKPESKQATVGDVVGNIDGATIGDVVGNNDGATVGNELASKVGNALGDELGISLASKVGNALGDELGISLASNVGNALGDELGISLASNVGNILGSFVGPMVGGGITQAYAGITLLEESPGCFHSTINPAPPPLSKNSTSTLWTPTKVFEAHFCAIPWRPSLFIINSSLSMYNLEPSSLVMHNSYNPNTSKLT